MTLQNNLEELKISIENNSNSDSNNSNNYLWIKHNQYRLEALNKFEYSIWSDIKHGLNISTKLKDITSLKDNINILTKGKTQLNISEYKKMKNEKDHTSELLLNRGITFISFKDFLQNEKYSEEYKKEIAEQIITNIHKKINNKLDYIHQIMTNIQLIIFDKKYLSENKIQIEKIIEGNSYNHLIIIINEESKLELYLKTSINHTQNIPNTSQNIITDFTEIIISKNCDIEIVEQRQLSCEDIIYGKKNMTIEQNSNVNWITIDTDSKLTFIENNAKLIGDNGTIKINNLICGNNSNYTLNNISEHIGTNTKSLMQNKCGLKNSNAIIKGLIKINKNANNSNGYQKSDIMLIDNNSRGISIPELEIHNNDVKCSHGSTITRLDEEKIFYLESRGINKNDAEKLLIDGFYNIILSNITNETLRNEIRIEVLK